MWILIFLPIVFVTIFSIVFAYLMLQMNSKTKATYISSEKLPKELRNDLVFRDDEYLDAGFEFCHNRITKRRGSLCYARYYLHHERLMMACDCVYTDALRTMRMFPTAIKSVLADGTVVETSSNEKLPEMFDELSYESRLRVRAAGSKNVAKLLDFHEQFLADSVAELNYDPIEIYHDMIIELDEYTLNLVDWEMYRCGTLSVEPEPLSFTDEMTAV